MISLLGIPYDSSSSFLTGAAQAPERIRMALLSPSSNLSIENGTMFDLGGAIQDEGDLTLSEGPIHREEITSAIKGIISSGRKSLVMGGDHSISYPVIRAHAEAQERLHIIQFDAHPDLYDELDGDRYSHACPFARLLEEFPHLKLTQIGIRTMNPLCQVQADRFGVRVFEVRDFPAPSVLDVQGPVYISLDLDVLYPAFAPGISHYEPGGFSVRDVLNLIHQISNPIVGADVVEYNPTRDRNDQTAMVAAKFLKELAGQMVQNAS